MRRSSQRGSSAAGDRRASLTEPLSAAADAVATGEHQVLNRMLEFRHGRLPTKYASEDYAQEATATDYGPVVREFMAGRERPVRADIVWYIHGPSTAIGMLRSCVRHRACGELTAAAGEAGSDVRANFALAFASEVAGALGIPSARVQLLEAEPGRRPEIVKTFFRIHPPAHHDADDKSSQVRAALRCPAATLPSRRLTSPCFAEGGD